MKYTQTLATKAEAVMKCDALGAYLPTIDDEEENDFIFNLIQKGTTFIFVLTF